MYDKSWNAGLPNSLARHDMGLSTIIGIENRDAPQFKLLRNHKQ